MVLQSLFAMNVICPAHGVLQLYYWLAVLCYAPTLVCYVLAWGQPLWRGRDMLHQCRLDFFFGFSLPWGQTWFIYMQLLWPCIVLSSGFWKLWITWILKASISFTHLWHESSSSPESLVWFGDTYPHLVRSHLHEERQQNLNQQPVTKYVQMTLKPSSSWPARPSQLNWDEWTKKHRIFKQKNVKRSYTLHPLCFPFVVSCPKQGRACPFHTLGLWTLTLVALKWQLGY